MGNPCSPPAILLQRVTESRTIDQEAAAWLIDALQRWQAGVDWQRASGLVSPDRAKIAIRDYWLTHAAEHLAGTPWQRARQLQAVAHRFERDQWPSWKRGSLPPLEASDMQVCLFLALRAGAILPETPQAYLAMLNKKL